MHLDALEDAHQHLDRLDRLESETAATHALLVADALTALVNNPAQTLPTPRPGEHARRTSAAELFADSLGQDEALTVLRILALLDRGQGHTPQARLLAQGLLAACAKGYADFYADEVAHG